MDEDAVLRLVGKVYEAAYDRSAWPRYLESLGAHADALAAYLVSVDPTGAEAGVLEGPLLSSDFDRKYREHFHKVDAWLFAYRRSGLGPGRVWGSHQILADAELMASEFYNDLLRYGDYFYTAGGFLFYDGTSMVGFGVHRSRRQGPPDERAMRLLATLMPHQQHALRIDCRLRRLEAVGRVAGGLLDELPFGLVALDRRGRVLALNRLAEDVLAAKDGLRLGRAGLEGLRSRDDRVLQRAIGEALAATPVGGVVELPRPSDVRPLRLVLAPVPRDGRPQALGVAPAALVFLHDPQRRAPPPAAALRRLYGLTPRQARLATLLAEGASLAEAAERLRVARETATSHLKQVFRKTGVRRQAELVRLLLSLPPGLGDA